MLDAIGSLCSGVGGLDRALSALLRSPVAWHCEVEPAPAEVLKVRMPAPNHGDITMVDWTDVPLVRALSMGVPCQPTSSAGRQLGDADPRWLWPDARTAIDVLRPEWIGFENVANLVSYDKGRLWRGILDDLQSLGYAVAWGIFGACLTAVSGCHHRHRAFLLARLSSTPGEPVRWSGKACGVPHRGAPLLATPTARDGEGRGEGDARYWEERSTRRHNGAPLGAQLNPLFPTPRAVDGAGDGRIDLRDRPNGTSLPTVVRDLMLPTPRATDGSNGGPGQRGSSGDLAMPSAVQPQNFGRYAWAVARWAAPTRFPVPAPTELGPRGGVRLAPAFPEWMMGYAPGYVTDILGRNDALKAIGNGVFPLQAYVAFDLLAPLLTPLLTA